MPEGRQGCRRWAAGAAVLGRGRLARIYRKMYSLMCKTVRLVLPGVKCAFGETGITLGRRFGAYMRTAGF
ncbi:hypothetical protein GCM10009551_060340 [Nocardiopsis tropica]